MLITGFVNKGVALAQQLSNRGSEFWAGYGHHQFMEPGIAAGLANSQQMALCFVAGEKPAHIIVTIPGTAYRQEYDVAAQSVLKSAVLPAGAPQAAIDCRLYTPPPGGGGTGSEGVFSRRGIHITSSEPIACYAQLTATGAMATSMLLPVNTWGYNYVSASVKQNNATASGNCFSWIYVIAQENNTRVRIIPSAATRNGKRAGEAFEITLQEGEIYQLLGAGINQAEGQDLSGSQIAAIGNTEGKCFPVAVFAGSSGTGVACTSTGAVSSDPLMQQVFPVNAWGARYITAPTNTDGAADKPNVNVFRIVVKDPATVVVKNGMRLYGLNGNYYEYQSDKADYIETDQPVLLLQSIPSEGSCFNVGKGDPELMYLSPLEQAVNKTVFYRSRQGSITVNYLTLLIKNEGVASLKIDGVLHAWTTQYAHPNLPGYTVVVKRWDAADAHCAVECDSAFTAITYGLGSGESYGFNAGTNLQNVSGKAAIHNIMDIAGGYHAYTCVNTPVKLSLLMRYKPVEINWRLSAMTAVAAPAADVVQRTPVPEKTETLNGQTWYTYTLPDTYRFNSAGVYDIPVYTVYPAVENCDHKEQIAYRIQVKAAPVAGFEVAYKACSDLQSVALKGDSLFADRQPVTKWNWVLTGAGETYTAGERNVDKEWWPGVYHIQLNAVSATGCVADSVRSITLTGKPVAAFAVQPEDVCVGEEQLFTDNSTINAGAIERRNWQFSDGSRAELPQVVKRFATAATYTIQLTVTSNQGCEATTEGQAVVHSLPVIDAGPAIIAKAGSVVKIAATAADTITTRFVWTPAAGLSDAARLNPNLLVQHDRVYLLTATNIHGCRASDELVVEVLKPVEVPGVFSPNGDGIHDTWVIPGLADYAGVVVAVYNRYGQQVFRSAGYSRAWDGMANGKPLPTGVYYYMIQLKNGMGQLQGSVTIVR